MLTCKVGETIINCFDGKYDKFTLKKWDEEKRLICPDCGKLYEYCHGEIVSPYFRHKEKSKECDEIFHEPETEEHLKGKMILYNWLLTLQEKGEISNVRLEGYIPETRQRPDLYFEKDNNRFVIEFQCTPIATEYFERHRLYELSNIHDIWIMGKYKYNIITNNLGATHYSRYKTLEKQSSYYFQTIDETIYIKNTLIKEKLPYKQLYLPECVGYKLFDLTLNESNILIKENILNDLILEDIRIYEERKDEIEAEKNKIIGLKNRRQKIVEKTLNMLNENQIEVYINYRGNTYFYKWAIDFELKYKELTYNFVFFIKENSIDFCRTDYSFGYNRIPSYINLKTYKKDNISDIAICNFIFESLSSYNELMKTVCKCINCNKYFSISVNEMKFFDSKSFQYPKRCNQCRVERKQKLGR